MLRFSSGSLHSRSPNCPARLANTPCRQSLNWRRIQKLTQPVPCFASRQDLIPPGIPATVSILVFSRMNGGRRSRHWTALKIYAPTPHSPQSLREGRGGSKVHGQTSGTGCGIRPSVLNGRHNAVFGVDVVRGNELVAINKLTTDPAGRGSRVGRVGGVPLDANRGGFRHARPDFT